MNTPSVVAWAVVLLMGCLESGGGKSGTGGMQASSGDGDFAGDDVATGDGDGDGDAAVVSGDGGGDGNGFPVELPERDPRTGDNSSCYDICAVQSEAEFEGDCVFLTVDECDAICDSLIMAGDCLPQLDDLQGCQLGGTFSCGIASAESDAGCDQELSDYSDCSDGGGACAGANDSGNCPQVACPCPDGDVIISGSQNTGSGCECLNEVTCQDLCF